MTQLQELRAALSEAVDDQAFVDAMILRIQERNSLPQHAPVAGYKKPALPSNMTHRQRMEHGSAQLADAIEAMKRGQPIRTSDEPIWRIPFQGGESHYGEFQHKPPVFAARHPCIKCGVREDRHRLHGCSNYVAAAL